MGVVRNTYTRIHPLYVTTKLNLVLPYTPKLAMPMYYSHRGLTVYL